ncbi:hypothetical protein GCM10027203_41950 [Nonomuraea fastidiosa]
MSAFSPLGREAPVREAPVREAPVREAPVREAPTTPASPCGAERVRASVHHHDLAQHLAAAQRLDGVVEVAEPDPGADQ